MNWRLYKDSVVFLFETGRESSLNLVDNSVTSRRWLPAGDALALLKAEHEVASVCISQKGRCYFLDEHLTHQISPSVEIGT